MATPVHPQGCIRSGVPPAGWCTARSPRPNCPVYSERDRWDYRERRDYRERDYRGRERERGFGDYRDRR